MTDVRQSGDRVAAEDVRVGDFIEMQTRSFWWRWGYVTRIGRSSTGGTIYFDGETDQGVPMSLTKRARSRVQRKGHRRA